MCFRDGKIYLNQKVTNIYNEIKDGLDYGRGEIKKAGINEDLIMLNNLYIEKGRKGITDGVTRLWFKDFAPLSLKSEEQSTAEMIKRMTS